MEVPGFPFYESQDERRRALSEPLMAFLSSGSAPIVFTLGSFAPQVSGSFYDVSIGAARAIRSRAVLLAGQSDAARLASSIGPNEFIFHDAPHDKLFPFATCIVHHGGIGTTAQAFRAGKPQLIVPFFGDQPDHSKRIERLGVGFALRLTNYDLQNSIEALVELRDDRYLCAKREISPHLCKRSAASTQLSIGPKRASHRSRHVAHAEAA